MDNVLISGDFSSIDVGTSTVIGALFLMISIAGMFALNQLSIVSDFMSLSDNDAIEPLGYGASALWFSKQTMLISAIGGPISYVANAWIHKFI